MVKPIEDARVITAQDWGRSGRDPNGMSAPYAQGGSKGGGTYNRTKELKGNIAGPHSADTNVQGLQLKHFIGM
jgi:hypothetical protein